MVTYFPILLVLLIARGVEPQCNSASSADSIFNSLSNDVINIDQKFQDVCKQFLKFAAKEVFGSNSYRLEIVLPMFDFSHFDVRLKHRVIYINGHYPQQGETCDLTYVDIKVLPDFVDTRKAAWTFKDSVLIIGLPYQYRLENHDWGCNKYIDDSVLYLRRGSPSERIFNDD